MRSPGSDTASLFKNSHGKSQLTMLIATATHGRLGYRHSWDIFQRETRKIHLRSFTCSHRLTDRGLLASRGRTKDVCHKIKEGFTLEWGGWNRVVEIWRYYYCYYFEGIAFFVPLSFEERVKEVHLTKLPPKKCSIVMLKFVGDFFFFAENIPAFENRKETDGC